MGRLEVAKCRVWRGKVNLVGFPNSGNTGEGIPNSGKAKEGNRVCRMIRQGAILPLRKRCTCLDSSRSRKYSEMSYLVIIEFLAVVVGAIYGVLLASRKGMDVMGVFAVAFSVAFGGGTLRDLFLDRSPLFWIGNPHYPVIVFAIAILSSFLIKHLGRLRPLLLLPDALGMALFTLTGTAYALDAGTTPFVAVLLGVITGTFGGVLGDVICNEVPSLFVPSPLNATCAFTGAWLYFGLIHFAVPERYALFCGIAVIVLFRLAAVKGNWCFPAVREPVGKG
jgi:uncharacterized membrane protein YeiH